MNRNSNQSEVKENARGRVLRTFPLPLDIDNRLRAVKAARGIGISQVIREGVDVALRAPNKMSQV